MKLVKLNTQFLIITGVGLLIGVTEALIYYNMGKAKESDKMSFSVPPLPDMMKTIGMVVLSSLVTAGITTAIEKGLSHKEVVAIA